MSGQAEVSMIEITENLVELIRSASTDLSPDVEQALVQARQQETAGSPAEGALQTILDNVALARQTSRPICQDTGTPVFLLWYPAGVAQHNLRQQIDDAVCIATERSYLRPNAVEPLSGKNSGDNTGVGFPSVHFEQWERPELKVALMLKGGGSENCGRQYAIPSPELAASRDAKGVRKAVLDAVFRAQGLGCAPGILGVGIGGDRGSGMVAAKEQLLRPLKDRNPDPELAALESQLAEEINQLGIGPMGFGGASTVLGIKMVQLHRVPASFFVSIAYMCWADRRKIMTITADGDVTISAP